MTNEEPTTKRIREDEEYRFIDYRLDQLELNLRKGMDKLETETKQLNHEIIQVLNAVQEVQTRQNKDITEINQRIKAVEEQMNIIHKLREKRTEHDTQLREIERRLTLYQQILFVVGTGVAIALIVDVLHVI